MHKINLCNISILIIALILKSAVGLEKSSDTTTDRASPQLDAPNFQRHILAELRMRLNAAATQAVDKHLMALQTTEAYANYSLNFEKLLQANSNNNNIDNNNNDNNNNNEYRKLLDEKIIFIKQLIDLKAQPEAATTSNNYYALRNINFLNKMQQQLAALLLESEREQQQLKMYQLCQQFGTEQHLSQQQNATPSLSARQLSLSRGNTSRPSRHNTNSVLQLFGATLYERIKYAGSEIIDTYLITLRQLLEDVLTTPQQLDMYSVASNAQQVNNVLHHIDVILETTDFAAKRDALYSYIQTQLALDYEQFLSADRSAAQQDLVELLLKFKDYGTDLFVNFLFSNFEFLEFMHAEWSILLQSLREHSVAGDAAPLQKLHKISVLYRRFKRQHAVNIKQYETYLLSVETLYEQTKSLPQESAHTYEILYQASQNVGAVTLNIIQSKCAEI